MDNTVQHNEIGKANFLRGLIFGVLTGFGTMLLLVPQSGKMIRAMDIYEDFVMLSRLDSRKILIGAKR